MNVGDAVLYVPNVSFAKTMNTSGPYAGLYAWAFEKPTGQRDEAGKPIVRDMTSKEIGIAILAARRGAGKQLELVPVRPQCLWPAKVTAVTGNTVSLSISSEYTPAGGVSWEHANVAIDPAGTKPESCHLEE